MRWIRLHYLYPNTITDALVEAMACTRRVVKYVDLPLQHAHPGVLQRMRRGGSAESHLRLLAKFRNAMPEVALRSTFIVGFPGETEEDFQTLLDFVEQARFDHLGAFAYSHEEGTGAHATVEDDVPEPVKQDRLDRLMALQMEISRGFNESLVGRRMKVLVDGEGEGPPVRFVGRTEMDAPEVDGEV